jgi:hypothetical protein
VPKAPVERPRAQTVRRLRSGTLWINNAQVEREPSMMLKIKNIPIVDDESSNFFFHGDRNRIKTKTTEKKKRN